MGLGIMGRLASGLRNTINTVSVGEAYLSKPKEIAAPQKFPELGVLQFGTRFKGMQGAINPFLSGVRPATGPTVARPGDMQFKGTGGAFAPEQSLQMTGGIRNLAAPMSQLQGSLERLGQNQQLRGSLDKLSQDPRLKQALGTDFAKDFQSNMAQTKAQLTAAGVPMDQQKAIMLQMMIEHINRMVQMISNIMKAAHEVAMTSIRNIKA